MLRTIFIYALITAIATGVGALPFAFKKHFSPTQQAIAQAIAAALMITASFGMIYEWLHFTEHGLSSITLWLSRSARGVVGGILLGLVFILFADKIISKRDDLSLGQLSTADTKKVLLIVGIMTLHSFAEGVAIGVSFEPALSFGVFIALAMAIHNIPEWLAISSVMTSKGIPRRKAGLWSIFSSLPQPLMAIPAFLFVEHFSVFLPVGLGFAAGAMLRMCFSELIPDALEGAPASTIATIATIAITLMIMFQQMLQ